MCEDKNIIDINEELSSVISAFFEGMQQESYELQKEKLLHFNQLCDAFFERHPEESIDAIVDVLVQQGVPYEQAMVDVAWAQGLASENSVVSSQNDDSVNHLDEEVSMTKVVETYLNSYKNITKRGSSTKSRKFKYLCTQFLDKNPKETEHLIRELVDHEINIDIAYRDVTQGRDISYINMLGYIDRDNIQDILNYIQKGFPLNICYEGSTCLHSAIIRGKKDMVRVLIENGADPEVKDEDGDTALHTAINWGKPDIVELLASLGADLNVYNANGFTPMSATVISQSFALALNGSKKAILNTLLEAGADINRVNEDKSSTLVHLAEYNSTDIFSRISKYGADVNLVHTNGRPLTVHLAMKARGYEPVIDCLIKAGTDIRAESNYGWNLYMVANWFSNEKLKELLKSYEYEETKENQEKLDFFVSIHHDNLPEIKRLTEQGIDKDIRHLYGDTAVIVAVAFQREEISSVFAGQ